MKRCTFLLLLVLTLVLKSVSAQEVYFGTLTDISNQRLGTKAGEAIAALIEARTLRIEMEDELQNARIAYWRSYENGNLVPDIAHNYVDLLYEKDSWFMLVELITKLGGTAKDPKTGRPIGVLDAFDQLIGAGKKFDGGIHPRCTSEFDTWVDAIAYDFKSQHGKWNVFDFTKVNQVITLIDNLKKKNERLYMIYLKKRNILEYLYKNPLSPLKSVNSKEFFTGILLSTNYELTRSEVDEEIRLLLDLVGGERNFKIALTSFGTKYPEFRKSGTHQDYLNYLYYELASQAADAETLALYSISLKYGCTWLEAKKVFENRKERYGRLAIEEALNLLWEDRFNEFSFCPTNPAFIDGPRRLNITERFVDCFADAMGRFVVEYDILDYAGDYMNKEVVKKEILDQMRSQYAIDNPEETYNKIIKVIDENLWLSAFYLDASNLGVAITERTGYLRSPFAFYILERLAILKNDKRLVHILALRLTYENYNNNFTVHQEYTNPYEAVLRGIQRYESGQEIFQTLSIDEFMEDPYQIRLKDFGKSWTYLRKHGQELMKQVAIQPN